MGGSWGGAGGETPKKALVHCTKQKFSAEKALQSLIAQNQKCFFATRKDVESYSQMPGKCILALEFSNFLGEAPLGASRLRHLLSGAGPPIPEIQDLSLA
jgi:hypothetical protein